MKSLNLLSVLVLTLFINGCSDKNDIEDKIIQQTIDAIKITEEEVTLNIGDSHTLTIKHSPENLPVPEYIWTSSNKDVATINAHGEIKALSIGVTIITALLLGASRFVAAEFTFFLAIPVMLGASALKLVKFGFSYTGLEIAILIAGVLTAFLVSVLAIKFLMKYIKKHDFKIFGVYRILLGIAVIIYFSIVGTSV